VPVDIARTCANITGKIWLMWQSIRKFHRFRMIFYENHSIQL